jgi:type II secretory pathway component GspD/PulD (secretin)
MRRNSWHYWIIALLILFILAPAVLGETARLISLDFKEADLKDVLRALAAQEGASFVIEADVSGPVTIHLTKVTFVDALAILAKNYNLEVLRDRGLYYISRRELLTMDYSGGLLTVEAVDARIKKVIELLAEKSGAKLVPAPELSGRITIRLRGVALKDGLQIILNQANCTEEKVGDVSFIKPRGGDRPFTVLYRNNLLSVDAQGVSLTALAREIAAKTGVSIIPDQNLNATITIYFQDLAVKDALNAICDTHGLLLAGDGALWRISRRSGAYRIRVASNRLSVDVDNAEVAPVLNEIARQAGVNILMAKEVSGPITAHFQNIPFFEGLSAMLESRGLVIDSNPDYYYVRTTTAASQNVRINYNSQTKLFDIEVQTSPITLIINEMARKAGVSVVVMPQVNWTVNQVRIKQVSFTDALTLLFKGTVFTYKQVGDVYLIGDGMVVRPENADFATVKVYPIRYIKADQLLNTLPPIFPRQNFVLLTEKNALIVTGPPLMHAQFNSYLEQVDTEAVDSRTEVIRIKHLKAEDVLKLFPPAIPKTDLVVIKEANAIAVTGPQNLINQVRQYIDKVDQVNPMIVFDILVVQISDSKGFTWKSPSGYITLDDGNRISISPTNPTVTLVEPSGTPSTTDLLVAALTALLQKGQAKILANPTISTLNGYPASFKVSTKWSFTVPTETTTVDSTTTTTNETVKTYDSGLYINITPWVSANNQITMEVKPTISEFGDPPSGSILPSTSERSTETTIRVGNKQTVVISGLRSTRKQKNVSKVPLLGDIPLIGALFRNVNETETQDEFVIVITPYLVFDEASRAEANKKILDRFNPELVKQAMPGAEPTPPPKKKK